MCSQFVKVKWWDSLKVKMGQFGQAILSFEFHYVVRLCFQINYISFIVLNNEQLHIIFCTALLKQQRNFSLGMIFFKESLDNRMDYTV